MLALVFERELCVMNLIFMTHKTCHHLAIEGINEPYHEIFATCDQYRRLVMPFYKIKVLLWYVFQNFLQSKVILHVPNA